MKIKKVIFLGLIVALFSLRAMEERGEEGYEDEWSSYSKGEEEEDRASSSVEEEEEYISEEEALEKMFISAEKTNDFEAVERWLQEADINEGLGAYQRTPLEIALYLGLTTVTQFFIEHGAILEGEDYDERTPLMTAILAKVPLDLVRLMIEKGANVNAIGDIGETPLQFAIINDDLDIVKLLVENGANINAFVPTLTYNVESRTLKELKELPIIGPLSTPLMTAAALGNKDIVQFLLEHGADPFVSDHLSNVPDEPITALTIAELKEHNDIVELIKTKMRYSLN